MESTIVNVDDAVLQFSRLLERAHAGELIVLAKAGVPYALLTPPPSLRGNTVAAAAGTEQRRAATHVPANVSDDPPPAGKRRLGFLRAAALPSDEELFAPILTDAELSEWEN